MKSNNNSGNFSAPCRSITPVHDFCSSVFSYVLIWLQQHRYLCPINPLYYIKTLDKKKITSKGKARKGFTLDIFIFFLTWKYIWKSHALCVISQCWTSPKAYSSAIQYSWGKLLFFFSRKNNNNNKKKKILEKMLPGLFPMCKYVQYVNLYLFWDIVLFLFLSGQFCTLTNSKKIF